MKIPKELLQGQDVKPGDEVCFTVASADDMSVELDDASVKVEPASEEASEPADANAPKPEMSKVMNMKPEDMRKNLPVMER
jgi:hypothetical protein